MASFAKENNEGDEKEMEEQGIPDTFPKLLVSYVRLSFALFLVSLPKYSLSLIPSLESRNKELSWKLVQAEEQLTQLKSRRREDSKANARVVEIFAGHRNAWQREEKKLLQQIEASSEEIAFLREKLHDLENFETELKGQVGGLKKEVSERDEMLDFMSRNTINFEDYDFESEVKESLDDGTCVRGRVSEDAGIDCYGKYRDLECLNSTVEDCFLERDGNEEKAEGFYEHTSCFNSELLPLTVSKLWAERGGMWQNDQYESPESVYQMKHLVARRETPWKMDGECGIASKLRLLEQELQNMEIAAKNDVSKFPSFLKKQAKRYIALVDKIDDLCKRMVSDSYNNGMKQQQREYLVEAFRLQQGVSETRQRLVGIETEAGKWRVSNARLPFHSMKNNFGEIQRNLEIWVARIIGDLEGIIARDGAGASGVRDFYVPRYPFLQYNHLNPAAVFKS